MVKERKVLFYFQVIIFYLTITCKNAVNRAKKHTRLSVLATQKMID